MKLPRRVPWASITELEQVCSWIYTDENDIEAKLLAVKRLSAWKAITHLPHALDSTLSILVAIMQDNSVQTQTSHLSLRQNYSAAIIRLVNGLVDPLQFGAYARSIASIASQLGLPSWLVELRHAATHEDLPSIELLREAARESMVWLLHNYFLPTINPSSMPEPQAASVRPLAPLLKQYKTLLKITTRDASLKSQYKPAIMKMLKEVERWISEAKVAANVATGEIRWESGAPENLIDSGELDAKERWALERLCDALLRKGGLVPLSKKKREFSIDDFSPPKFSVLLWKPLLQHLYSLHPHLPVVLCGRIVSGLLAPDNNQTDVSYDICLARWAMWSIETWDNEESQAAYDLRREVTHNLMYVMGRAVPDSRKGAIALLRTLCKGDPNLEITFSTLLRLSDADPSTKWDSNDIAVMGQRLDSLLSSDMDGGAGLPRLPPTKPLATDDEIVPGWRYLDETTNWKPCPIGVHCATT